MTRRYYADSYTRVFPARVVEATRVDDAPAVVLDETFFYPTSGGQPHDTGALSGVPVTDVRVRPGDGAVVHLVAGLVEGNVEGVLDWPRRFDHMQQHSGQHILSAAFVKLAGAPTIGFHLGQDYVSIDLGVRALEERTAQDAEELANTVIRSNLPVRAWFPTADELAAIPLRKTPEVEGELRVVAMGDFDFSACGGTHVTRTGEVGSLKLLRTEKLTRGIRVAFLCGDRARADYARKHALVKQLAGSLTCAPEELAEAVARLDAALSEARRDAAVWRTAALGAEAERMLAGAAEGPVPRTVVAAFRGRPADELRELALALTTGSGVVALLGTTGEKTQLIFARSEDVSQDLKPLLDRALAELGGGKGGGGRVVQGGAAATDPARLEAALDAARAMVRRPG